MKMQLRMALAGQVLLMLAGLVSPLLLTATGTAVYLETRPVDPRAMFRGDYVTLSYAIGEDLVDAAAVKTAKEPGSPLYVTITTDRPARVVEVDLQRPKLEAGQACLIGRVSRLGNQATVEFPQIAQYFVAEGEGREIERQLGEGLWAVVKTSRRCRAMVADLVTSTD